jgi:hypothetical protein
VPEPPYIGRFLAMSDIANLNLSSFEAVDVWGEHILSDTMALIATKETPSEIKTTVLRLWFDGRDIEDLPMSQSADAILLNTIIHLLHETGGSLDAIMRHVNIPPNYMPVFWKMEKDSHGTPTPNELEDMFQLEE